MDALTFIATLAQHLAWPLATVWVVVLLRAEIKKVLLLIRKVKAGPVEAEFEREVVALAAKQNEPEPEPREIASQTPERVVLLRVAESSPQAAIMEAWRQVEVAATSAAARRGVQVSNSSMPLSGSLAFKLLLKTDAIPTDWIPHYYELRNLRNRVTHEEAFSPSRIAAIAYVELSLRLTAVLNAISPSAG